MVVIIVFLTACKCPTSGNSEADPISENIESKHYETEDRPIEKTEDTHTEETTSDPEVPTEPVIEYVSLGEFRITAYCACKKCCGEWAENRPLDENGNPIVYGSTGIELISGYSIAVDPRVIPYGTKVYFNDREYIAHDCGGAIKENRIDLYMNSHQAALEWGVQYYEVFVPVEEVGA